jgi:hypothetical protein
MWQLLDQVCAWVAVCTKKVGVSKEASNMSLLKAKPKFLVGKPAR